MENHGQLGTGGAVLYSIANPMSIAFFNDRIEVSVHCDGAGTTGASAAYEMDFIGANPVRPEGSGPSGTRYSFFMGDDPTRWVTGATGFDGVVYRDLWDGIDLFYRADGPRVKYEFIVESGASPASICLGVGGALGVAIDGEGDLVVRTAAGCVRDESPVSYQIGPGPLSSVDSSFLQMDDGTVGFRVGSYDPSRTLVIDPTLIFSSFVGTGSNEWVQDCAVDGKGDVYLMGATDGVDLPTTTGAVDPTYNGGTDVFLCKLSKNGMKLLYCTYIGGSGNDGGYYSGPSQAQNLGGLCIGSDGSVYVTGHTNSTDFPTTAGAYDRTQNGGYDAFVLKLGPGLDSLDYSTYVGGVEDDFPTDIIVDSLGDAIVVGTTLGSFPVTSGAFDVSHNGAEDAFAIRLGPTGGSLLRSTYLGGSLRDFANAVAVDGNGLTYVVGATEGGGFPTANAFDSSHNGLRDMFILKLDATWAGLVYSTFVGTPGQDYANDVWVDFSDRAYVVGYTAGAGFPTTSGSYRRTAVGGLDCVVLRLSADGSFIDRCTYFGGTSDDRGYGLALDPGGDVIVTGYTLGTTPTTSQAYCSTNAGDMDVFLARFDATLTTLRYGSMFGGSGEDKSWAIASGALGDMIVAGHTTSPDFPATAGSFDDTFNGGVDGFVLKVGEPKPPAWRAMPSLRAVEDVPLTYDFSGNVTDPDTPLSGLSIASTSAYVSAIDGLKVTFLFPNGVLGAKVALDLKDGFSSTPGTVNFTIEPVNDVPILEMPGTLDATEGVPLIIDFALYVRDVDNLTRDLRLSTDSVYAKVDNLTMTLTFPNGVLSYDLWFNVSDGLASVEGHVVVHVRPVEDPPVIAALPTFEAVEDRESVFDLSPYVSDVDTPTDQLRVTVGDPNITVRGMELHYLTHRGNVRFSVSLVVTDGTWRVSALLWVHVTEVNDAPIVLPIPTQLFIEDTEGIMDLANYVVDEDTPLDALVVECNDPNVVFAKGLRMDLLFKMWVPDYALAFTVFDGMARANGSFEVQVQPVNDPPAIVAVGGLTPPFSFELDEGADAFLPVTVTDEDSPRFEFTVVSQWSGISVLQNGTVHISTDKGDVGNHTAVLNVDDMNGGNTSATINVRVRNVNDPPTRLLILEPYNHSTFERGDNVTFSVDVSDPDTVVGQVLTVTWTSNISGLLRRLDSVAGLHFTTSSLPVGVHRITVNASDGQYSREAWLELTVEPEYVQPPQRPTEPNPIPVIMAVGGVALAIFFFILIAAMIVVMNRRGKAEEEVSMSPPPPGPKAPEPPAGPLTMEGDLAKLGRNISDMAAQLEATRAAEAKAAAALPAGPAPALEAVTIPVTEEDEADREHAREVREVMKTLTQLPQGLPTSLWGWDMNELARTVVDGERRRTADGTPLVLIKGRWYIADRTNVGVFMREWKEPEATAPVRKGPMTADERRRRLEQLETALLDGKISEQTYRELMRKYEGGG